MRRSSRISLSPSSIFSPFRRCFSTVLSASRFFSACGNGAAALGPEPIPERPDQVLEHVEGNFDSRSRAIQPKRRYRFDFQVVAHRHYGTAAGTGQDEADQVAGGSPQEVDRQRGNLLGFAVDGTFELFECLHMIEKLHQDYLCAVFPRATFRAGFCFRFEIGDEVLFRPYNQRHERLSELDRPVGISQFEQNFAWKKKRPGQGSISNSAPCKNRAPYGKSEVPGSNPPCPRRCRYAQTPGGCPDSRELQTEPKANRPGRRRLPSSDPGNTTACFEFPNPGAG